MINKTILNYLKITACQGWLSMRKNGYGIRQLTISGEKLSADKSGALRFKNDFKQIVEEYALDQIFHADETGLNFKILPTKSLASKAERGAVGYKRS
ncbi:hypothetical protein QE152_g7080 [Popillia japonica]|uniref:Transposase n=1 Tax=Popillia japonica TaxID=7064 RepID=A0AAW1MFZ3_POPJA